MIWPRSGLPGELSLGRRCTMNNRIVTVTARLVFIRLVSLESIQEGENDKFQAEPNHSRLVICRKNQHNNQEITVAGREIVSVFWYHNSVKWNLEKEKDLRIYQCVKSVLLLWTSRPFIRFISFNTAGPIPLVGVGIHDITLVLLVRDICKSLMSCTNIWSYFIL